jgi:hypothetical protein
MIGLEPFRPDLQEHDDIANTIETAVQSFTIEELEKLNLKYRQAGVPALQREEFLKTKHVSRPVHFSNLANLTEGTNTESASALDC